MKDLTEAQISELESQVRQGDSDNKYFKRVQAVCWLSQGRTVLEVMEFSGFSRTYVFRLRAKYEAKGLEGLRSNYVGSNYRKLSYAEEAAALEKLSKVAESGKFVRAQELSKQMESITGVCYQIDAFYRLLWRHNWRKVMPRGKHPRAADEAACEAVKKLTLRSDS